jgi:hypothetical protein
MTPRQRHPEVPEDAVPEARETSGLFGKIGSLTSRVHYQLRRWAIPGDVRDILTPELIDEIMGDCRKAFDEDRLHNPRVGYSMEDLDRQMKIVEGVLHMKYSSLVSNEADALRVRNYFFERFGFVRTA